MLTYRFKYLSIALALGLGLVAGCAPQNPNGNQGTKIDTGASGTSQDPLANLQPIVQKSSQGQFRAVKLFDAPEGLGLKGVLLESAQGGPGKIVAWADPKGQFLLPGPLFDKDGTNLAEKLLNEQAGYLTPDKIADQVIGQGFMAGKSGPVMTVFFEPYCGYCNKLFGDLKPRIEKGKLRVRFIMVGFLRPDSLARAAEIQNAKNPYEALKKWEELADKASAKEAQASESDKAKIKTWNDLMGSGGQTGTPAILYCNDVTGKVEMSKGMPSTGMEPLIETVGSKAHKSCKA